MLLFSEVVCVGVKSCEIALQHPISVRLSFLVRKGMSCSRHKNEGTVICSVPKNNPFESKLQNGHIVYERLRTIEFFI